MSCDDCALPDRRAFLAQAIALLGVGGLAACASSMPTAPTITSFSIKVADFPGLASAGGLAVVDSGSASGDPIAVARVDATTFLALSLICPHRGFTVVISGSGFYCPGHGATFSDSGAWTGGQQTSNLSRYAASYDATTGMLTIG